MNTSNHITTLFLDIGGIFLTNGWDHHARGRAIEEFHLDADEVNERHHLTFDTYEAGKLTLKSYLNRVIFYEERNFSQNEFIDFMFSQSQPLPEMFQFIKKLKEKYFLKTVAVSNEGRELTEYRIRKFGLQEVLDIFICSCYIHLRKPDEEIFQLAINISQVSPGEVLYLDDRKMFVQVAKVLGINGIHHRDFLSTRKEIENYGLSVD